MYSHTGCIRLMAIPVDNVCLQMYQNQQFYSIRTRPLQVNCTGPSSQKLCRYSHLRKSNFLLKILKMTVKTPDKYLRQVKEFEFIFDGITCSSGVFYIGNFKKKFQQKNDFRSTVYKVQEEGPGHTVTLVFNTPQPAIKNFKQQ